MKILAHRGDWDQDIPNNSPEAIRRALENGYGFESDVRDYAGTLVISHNIANRACQQAKEIFSWLAEFHDRFPFAINIKADGLISLLTELLQEYHIQNYFTFDMSVPQMIEFQQAGLRFFTRQSEVESTPILYQDAAGVWIDGFFGEDWITESMICTHLHNGKAVCLVSPELHHRSHQTFWEKIKHADILSDQLMLCTDLPHEASRYFGD